MKKVNELNINITKAVITRISIELNLKSNEPEWTVTGQLITDAGKSISEFMFSTNHWMTDSKLLKVPVSCHTHARNLFIEFTPLILEKLNGVFKKLPAKK